MSQFVEGLFGWVDCSSTEVSVARKFYTELFGWESDEEPMPGGSTYITFRKDGKRVAGLGPTMTPDAPSAWTSYVLVADADAVQEKIVAAGGSVIWPATSVTPETKVGIFASPSGAITGLLQDTEGGAELFNVPGSLTWNELSSRDVPADQAFFAEVFGWQFQEVPESGGYFTIMLDAKPGDDKSNGGLMAIAEQLPADVPSHWGVYFAVPDCEEASVAAVDLGATVFLPPMQMGPGVFSGITDPTGAKLYIGSF